jgi:hypothetical protein
MIFPPVAKEKEKYCIVFFIRLFSEALAEKSAEVSRLAIRELAKVNKSANYRLAN